MLLDFSDSSFISDPADGKNCMTSRCTDVGNNLHAIFLKANCNSTDSNVQGLCGKYRLIVFIMGTTYLTYCYSLEDSIHYLDKNVDI